MPLHVLISHAHDERPLAEAWKTLLETVSQGAIRLWYSSDNQPSGGMAIGQQWRDSLRTRIAESQFVLAVLSPRSRDRPWILWECGVASGATGERGVVPVTYSMGAAELANPLSSFQVYAGDQRDVVVQVCQRLLIEAGLNPRPALWTTALDTYMASVETNRPRRARRAEDMTLWRTRVEELLQSGRRAEVPALRTMMYASFGSGFESMDAQLHDVLSKALLDLKQFQAAREEVDRALRVTGDDVALLHRRVLAELGLGELDSARKTVEQLYGMEPSLRDNSECAGLEGRIYRERHDRSHDPADLQRAVDAYRRAFNADPTSYYTGVNYAALLLRANDATAPAVFERVLWAVEHAREQPPVSFWADFTAGECRLALGQVDEALAEYRKGIIRTPAPSDRDRDSALGGVRRMATLRGLEPQVVAAFEEGLR